MPLLDRLRSDRGSAVAEFPLVAVLVLMIALATVQAAVIVHTRNSLVDAAVQGARHAALVGSEPDDGAARARELVRERFGDAYDVTTDASEDPTGRVTVRVRATFPLVGLLGPAAALEVEGHAVDEDVL